MRIFPPPLEIGDHEGFAQNKDIFDRARIGEGLTNLILSVDEPLVIALDGQWGSGKTTFLKMWAGELRKADIPVVLFDAFAKDYSEDAFTALASEIISLAQRKQKEGAPAAKEFVDRALGAGKIILRSGLKLGVKVATVGVLNAADLKDAAADAAEEASSLTDRYIGELLTKQRAESDAIQAFRNALMKLPSLLANSSDDMAAKRPLVVIVDELDRCRPLFALQVLERIKHFYSVPGVFFVLGAHLGQMHNSIQVAYGPNIDAHTYLQKFVHLTVHLVDDALHRHQSANVRFIEYLRRVMGFKADQQQVVDYAFDYFQHISERRNLSLRAIEQIISTLAIAMAAKPRPIFAPPPIIAGLCFLKIVEPSLYVQAKSGAADWEALRGAMRLAAPAEESLQNRIKHMRAYWQYCTDRTLPENHEFKEKFGRGLDQADLTRDQAVAFVANAVIDSFDFA